MSTAAQSVFAPAGRLNREAELLRHEVSGLRRLLRNLQDITDLVDGAGESEPLGPLADRVLGKILDATAASGGALMLVDDATGELVYVAATPSLDIERLLGQRIPADRGLAGWVVAHRSPMVMEDQQGARPRGLSDQGPWGATLTIVAAPLVAGGEVIGVVETLHRQRLPFSPEHLEMLTLACRLTGELLHSLDMRRARTREAY